MTDPDDMQSRQAELLSIVSPVYMGEDFVDELVARVCSATEELPCDVEIVLVDDRSPDRSWEAIQHVAESNDAVKGVRLSRNFGQHHAIRAGLDHAEGDWVIVMDCDLQDRPEEIPRLYHKAKEEDVEMVKARRLNKQFSSLKRWTSAAFYRVFAQITDVPQDASIGNFGIYSRKVVDALRSMGQFTAFFPAMVQRVGFTSTTLDVQHDARKSGESSYNLKSLISLAIGVILGASDKPLKISIGVGAACSLIGFAYAMSVVIRILLGGRVVAGWASLIVSIWVLAGITISLIGMVGLTVSNVLRESQQLPVYFVETTLNEPAVVDEPVGQPVASENDQRSSSS